MIGCNKRPYVALASRLFPSSPAMYNCAYNSRRGEMKRVVVVGARRYFPLCLTAWRRNLAPPWIAPSISFSLSKDFFFTVRQRIVDSFVFDRVPEEFKNRYQPFVEWLSGTRATTTFSLSRKEKKNVPEATQTCVLQRIVKYGGTASGIFGSRAYYSEC